MRQIQLVSDSELILMRIIWESGGMALYAQIFDTLSQKGMSWNKNTIITLLSRLVEKGLLKTNKIGRRNEYTALVSEPEYHTAQTKQFVDKVYDGNVKGLINTLLGQGFMPAEEQDELLKIWKGGERK